MGFALGFWFTPKDVQGFEDFIIKCFIFTTRLL